NLIIYWGGFDSTWKLACAMVAGLALFAIGAWRSKTSAARTIRNAIWIVPWLAGHVGLGALGRYGGGYDLLPDWVDVFVLIAFSLAIYHLALAMTLPRDAAAAAIAKDAHQIEYAGLH